MAVFINRQKTGTAITKVDTVEEKAEQTRNNGDTVVHEDGRINILIERFLQPKKKT